MREKQNRLMRRYESPTTTLTKEQGDKLKIKKPTLDELVQNMKADVRRHKRRIKPAPIDHEAAKYLVWTAIRELLQEENRKFVLDGNLKEVLPNLIKYFTGDPSGLYDLQKGIYLFGEVGTGKSFLIRMMRSLCNVLKYEPRQFKIYNAKTLLFEVEKAKNLSAIDKVLRGGWCVDDLGAEDNRYKLFGNDISVMGYVLNERYELYHATGEVFHVSSNIDPNLIYDEYGERLESRCSQMFNFVKLEGTDKRRKKKTQNRKGKKQK